MKKPSKINRFLVTHREHEREFYVTMIRAMEPVFLELARLAVETSKKIETCKPEEIKGILFDAMQIEKVLHRGHRYLKMEFVKSKKQPFKREPGVTYETVDLFAD